MPSLAIPTEQKQRQALVDRRHPAYAARLPHWQFCRATYDGGRDWFEQHLFKYFKEGEQEFQERKERAYRFNHTREVVHLVTKYIFKAEVLRNRAEAPEPLRQFWARATKDGRGIDALMRQVSELASIHGRVWVGTDSLVPVGGVATRAEEKQGEARVYAYTVGVEDVLDYSWDEQGRLRWILYRVCHRDDADPISASGELRQRYVLWTREAYAVLEERRAGASARKREILVVDAGDNPIGEVPLFPVDDRESDNPYDVPGLVDDIAYLDRAVANYLSNLDAIIQDQTFSQLVIPAQGLLPGDEAYNQLREMGTKRIFSYDGEAGAAPAYIAPDPKQAAMILAIVNKIIAEIYHSVGMAGERTKQDNAVGIDNSSGVAKAYDFERVNSLLAAKADVLERAEDRLASLVGLWTRTGLPQDAETGGPKDLVKYPDSFDVRSLYDEFEIAEAFSLVQAPDALRREQMRGLVKKLFPRLDAATAATIEADLKAWPPSLDLAATSLGLSGGGAKLAAGQVTQSRQGQVTPGTPGSPKGSKPAPNQQ